MVQSVSKSPIDRRQWLTLAASGLGGLIRTLPSLGALTAFSGCLPRGTSAEPDLVIGSIGIGPGRFQKPRAIAMDALDRLFVVDMTGRIQVLTAEGQSLAQWRTPDIYQGKPTGLTIAPSGNLWVADTHYHRILEYTPEGELLTDRTLGGTQGIGPGEFGLVTDIVIDSQQRRYVSEYGSFDRIQVFDPEDQFIMQWGQTGEAPGDFTRPQCMAVDDQDRIWVADACNHRVQVFEIVEGRAKLLDTWGSEGREPGQMRYPYGLLLAPGNRILITEYGNHRVQLLTRSGEPLESWGIAGRSPGQLDQPWASALDSKNRCYVLDSYNHRIQRFQFASLRSA